MTGTGTDPVGAMSRRSSTRTSGRSRTASGKKKKMMSRGGHIAKTSSKHSKLQLQKKKSRMVEDFNKKGVHSQSIRTPLQRSTTEGN